MAAFRIVRTMPGTALAPEQLQKWAFQLAVSVRSWVQLGPRSEKGWGLQTFFTEVS